MKVASRNPALLLVLLYFAFQVFFLTTISNGAGVDDAEQLAYVGALQWGYGGSQAPLYTWINSIAGNLFEISMFTIYLVKFGMLASSFISVYFGARLLGLSKSVAAAGMLGIFLLPQIAWESQRTLTSLSRRHHRLRLGISRLRLAYEIPLLAFGCTAGARHRFGSTRKIQREFLPYRAHFGWLLHSRISSRSFDAEEHSGAASVHCSHSAYRLVDAFAYREPVGAVT